MGSASSFSYRSSNDSAKYRQEPNSKYSWKTTTHDITKEFGNSVRGKTAIITGCNSGIGFQVAKSLAKSGAEVIFACRSKDRAAEAINQIKKEYPKANITFLQLDLSEVNSIRDFCDRFRRSGRLLHILVNNAVAEINDTEPITVRDEQSNSTIDYQLQVNYLGHFLLTMELLDIMRFSSSAAMRGRVINISSFTNYFLTPEEGVDFHQLISRRESEEQDPARDCNEEKRAVHYSKYEKHGASKLAMLLFTKQLAAELAERDYPILALSVHPGFVPGTASSPARKAKRSSFASSVFTALMSNKTLWKKLLQEPRKNEEQGAATIAYCAMTDDSELATGKHYADCHQTQRLLHSAVENKALAKDLWDLSCEVTHAKAL